MDASTSWSYPVLIIATNVGSPKPSQGFFDGKRYLLYPALCFILTIALGYCYLASWVQGMVALFAYTIARKHVGLYKELHLEPCSAFN